MVEKGIEALQDIIYSSIWINPLYRSEDPLIFPEFIDMG